MPSIHYTLLGVVLCYLYAAVQRRYRKNLPPGPNPLPLIGNVLDVPKANPWKTYTKWKEQYGDVVHIKVFKKHIVVLNSAKAVNEILEKRSAKTSGRPYSVMMNELINWGRFGVFGYNSLWRTHRKLFHSYFNETMALNHRPTHERAIHHLLRRLFDQPDKFMDSIRLQFAETIMSVVYDIEVKDHSNIYVQTVEKALQGFSQAVVPGRFLVDTLWPLKFVPAWFPGAEFKRLAAQWKAWSDQAMELPFSHVKENMEKGTAGPSMLSFLLEQCETDETNTPQFGSSGEYHAKAVAGTAYTAGSDTVLSSVQTSFLLIANHPEYQKAAQTELDAVLGGSRLPTYADIDDLPYIHALVNEILRYHPALPTGIPHRVDEDDEYEGYLLPKGAILIPNTWLILRDPGTYPNPHIFNPMRWLTQTDKGLIFNKSIPDPVAVFGYGRRICPGRFFAKDSLFLTVASVLTCFYLSPLDSDGNPTKSLPENFTDGAITYPVPFKLSITPRSEFAVRLLQDIEP